MWLKQSKSIQDSDEIDELPVWAYTDSHLHAESVQIWKKIKNLTQSKSYDYIEFPDYHGLAFSTIFGLRELGSSTKVVIRVHSSDFILRKYDFRFEGGIQKLLSHNLEIRSIQEADLIVCHSESILSHTLSSLNGMLSPQQLNAISPKFVVNYPDYLTSIKSRTSSMWQKDKIVFASKIQELKNPELFLKAVIHFMTVTPEYTGDVHFSALVENQLLYKKLLNRIPTHLQHRIHFHKELTETQRGQLFAGSLVCIPSSHEALSLLAYEALLAGGVPVLNSECAPFADSTVWNDGENCIKFEGKALDLSRKFKFAFEGNFEYIHTFPKIEHWCCYCDDVLETSPDDGKHKGSNSEISVVIAHKDMPDLLRETLIDTLSFLEKEDEILIIDDGSNIENSQKLKSLVSFDSRLKLRFLGTNFGLAAARNEGLRLAKAECVIILDADDFLVPSFVFVARKLIDSKRADIVVPQVGMFTTDTERLSGTPTDYAVFQGSGVYAGAIENRLGSATLAIRRSLALEISYNESLTSYEDWDFLARAGFMDVRIHVYEKLGLHYRTRLDSMVRTTGHLDRSRNLEIVRSNYFIPGNSLLNLNFASFIRSDGQDLNKHSPLLWMARNRLLIIRLMMRLGNLPIIGRMMPKVFLVARAYARRKGLTSIPARGV